MRACFWKTFAVCCGLCTAAEGEAPYPYLVHTAAEGTPLRSGPGEDYYETSRLAAATALEVWRRAPEGWLAVRPPKDSFSLVQAADVRVRPDRVAEVVRPDAPARVGSDVASERDVVQVFLTAGERVQVLETISLDGEFWHKIAPPSGEFRWIHETQVAGPVQDAGPVAASSPRPPQPTAAGSVPPSGYRVARHSEAAGTALPPASNPLNATEPTTQTLAELIRGDGTPHAGDGAITITEIELELATIVAEDPKLWNFTHLKSLCSELLHSASPAARAHEVEALLERISRFERIRDVKQSFNRKEPAAPDGLAEVIRPQNAVAQVSKAISEPLSVSDDVGDANDREAGITWRAARREESSSDAEPVAARGEVVRIPDSPAEPLSEPGRYDGIGTLRPVVSRRREAPRYALVDPEGDVVTFITPSPGVNLQPYVGQRIGVVGTRGYMPEFKRTHVTAARVTPLR